MKEARENLIKVEVVFEFWGAEDETFEVDIDSFTDTFKKLIEPIVHSNQELLTELKGGPVKNDENLDIGYQVCPVSSSHTKLTRYNT